MGMASRALLASAVAAVAVVLMAGPAATAPTPVVYANGSGWHDASRRPADFYFFGGNGPYIRKLSWQYWGPHGNAYGQGRLETQTAGCTPSYLCLYHGRWVSMLLRDVRTHDGRKYFAKMAIRFHRHGRWHHQHLTFKRVPPATAPAWQGPDKWPWS